MYVYEINDSSSSDDTSSEVHFKFVKSTSRLKISSNTYTTVHNWCQLSENPVRERYIGGGTSRVRKTPEQTEALNEAFAKNRYPSVEEKKTMAHRLSLSHEQVSVFELAFYI